MAELIMFLAALVIPDNVSVKVRSFQKKCFAEGLLLPSFGCAVLCPLAFFTEKPEIATRIILKNLRFITDKLISVNDDLYLEIPGLNADDFYGFITVNKSRPDITEKLPFPAYPGIYLGKTTGKITDTGSLSGLAWKKSTFTLLDLDIHDSGNISTFVCRTVLERSIINS